MSMLKTVVFCKKKNLLIFRGFFDERKEKHLKYKKIVIL